MIGLLATPLAQADTDPAYGDLSNVYHDAITFDSSFDLSEEVQFFSALASLGNVLSASGLDLSDPFSSSATASSTVVAVPIVKMPASFNASITGEAGMPRVKLNARGRNSSTIRICSS